MIKDSINLPSLTVLAGDYSEERNDYPGGPVMGAERDEALDILRAVWRGQGQGAGDLADDESGGRSCKRMTDVGFDEFAGGETERSAAWRAMLAREGKLRPSDDSIREHVLGSAESR